MSETSARRLTKEPIIIRFDGLDADKHEIELAALAESLKGFSRILGVAGNFAATQKYVQHKDALSVRVMVVEPEAKCFQIAAWIEWVNQNPLLTTVVGGLTVSLVAYIFNRAAGQRAEMRELRGALDTAIKELGTRDQKVVDRLLDTVDKMADALKPAVKQAVSPIGETASSITVLEGPNDRTIILKTADKDAILSEDPNDISETGIYHVALTELNLDNGNCRVALREQPEPRIPAVITDPVISQPNNVYSSAFAAHKEIMVKAKASIRDGQIEKLFISDVERRIAEGSD